MSAYFIAQISIYDPDIYEKYLAGFDKVFACYKGEVIVVDEEPEVLEGRWNHSRIVMIRFPDRKEARRWYESAEYQQLVKYRHAASSSDVILAEGRD